MTIRIHSAALALLLFSAACANVPLGGEGLPARSSQPTTDSHEATWSTPDRQGEVVLYARDGSPVRRTSSESALTAGQEAPPPRSVSDGSGSRPYLLELYQQAVSEKDQLSLEVSRLNQELAQSDESYRALQRELEQLKSQYSELEKERDEIQKQNFELAGRLTTAQIRRLESEKMLLETIIEQRRNEREREEAAADEEARGFLNPDTGELEKDGGRR